MRAAQPYQEISAEVLRRLRAAVRGRGTLEKLAEAMSRQREEPVDAQAVGRLLRGRSKLDLGLLFELVDYAYGQTAGQDLFDVLVDPYDLGSRR